MTYQTDRYFSAPTHRGSLKDRRRGGASRQASTWNEAEAMLNTPARSSRLSTTLLSIALILSGAIPAPALAQTTSGTVVGTVYDKSTGKGVSAALMIAVNETNGFRQTARSSDSGTYSVANLPQGYYTL